MSRKSTGASLALVTLLTLVFGAGSFQASHRDPTSNLMVTPPQRRTTPQRSCDQILRAARASVRRAIGDRKLKEFKDTGYRFGFSCKQGVVTLRGALPHEEYRQKVIKTVRSIPGVRDVDDTNFKEGGGCLAGEIDCYGDGTKCVAKQADCELEGFRFCCGALED